MTRITAPHCGTMTLVASRLAASPVTRSDMLPWSSPMNDERTKTGMPPGKLEHGIRLQVDTGVVGLHHRLGGDHRGLSPGGPHEVDGVAPDVHERPAAEIPVEADVPGCTTKWGML